MCRVAVAHGDARGEQEYQCAEEGEKFCGGVHYCLFLLWRNNFPMATFVSAYAANDFLVLKFLYISCNISAVYAYEFCHLLSCYFGIIPYQFYYFLGRFLHTFYDVFPLELVMCGESHFSVKCEIGKVIRAIETPMSHKLSFPFLPSSFLFLLRIPL